MSKETWRSSGGSWESSSRPVSSPRQSMLDVWREPYDDWSVASSRSLMAVATECRGIGAPGPDAWERRRRRHSSRPCEKARSSASSGSTIGGRPSKPPGCRGSAPQLPPRLLRHARTPEGDATKSASSRPEKGCQGASLDAGARSASTCRPIPCEVAPGSRRRRPRRRVVDLPAFG